MAQELLSAGDLVAILRSRCEAGQATWARAHGLSEGLISSVLSGRQKPGPKIAAALGYKRKVVFMGNCILDKDAAEVD